MDQADKKPGDWFATASKTIGLIILVGYIIGLLALLISTWNSVDVRTMVMQRFPVIVGLPASGIFSFLLVALFESNYGNIEFEFPGLKLRGAAGPIVMWVLTFLAIVGAIRLLWPMQ